MSSYKSAFFLWFCWSSFKFSLSSGDTFIPYLLLVYLCTLLTVRSNNISKIFLILFIRSESIGDRIGRHHKFAATADVIRYRTRRTFTKIRNKRAARFESRR